MVQLADHTVAARTPGERPPFRHDVEGLRAIAILLVAGYHVWGGGRVSGGVDVFLMISGFFVGGGLLRKLDAPAFGLGRYVARLGRRLVPPLLLTLAAVVVGTIALLPRSEFSDVGGGVLASAAYVENWRMAIAGQAYAAADPMSSPVQHIWSLSVQGQLFLGLPLLLLALRAALRRAGLGPRALGGALAWVVAALAVASFAYATWGVAQHQAVAYFDTGARVWEYLAGTLVALLAARWRPGAALAVVLGWTGLALVLATGLLVDARATFPGPWALVPILGAAFVIVAGLGQAGGTGSAVGGPGRVLGWRPLVVAGGYAYEFYLWHWVVLVFALAATGRESLGWLSGSLVLLGSAVVALVSRRVTRFVVPDITGARRRLPVRALAVVTAAATTLTVLAPIGWLTYRDLNPWTGLSELDVAQTPGALTLLDPQRWPTPAGVEMVPGVLDAADDWPLAGREDCDSTDKLGTEVRLCVLGDPEGRAVVALVGGSHAVNFAEPIDRLATESRVRVEGYFKQGCPLGLEAGELETPEQRSCLEWNRAVLDHLAATGVSGVLTTGTRPASEVDDDTVGDQVPASYLAAWTWLGERGIGVAAIRDNPWFPQDARRCVEEHGPDSLTCVVERDLVLGPDPLQDVGIDSVTAVDLSDALCEEQVCRPVVGNVLAYIDSNHLTATFTTTLTPAMDRELSAVPWWP